jgi:hypothetical protein
MNELPIEVSFNPLLADHLAAERLYYRSTFFWKIDKVVAIILLVAGLYLLWIAGVRWWTIVWFPIAAAEWFNMLSPRPLQILYWFKHNPKFRETYHLTIDQNGLHFQTKTIDSHIQWNHFSRLLEDNRLCLLIYGTRMYSVFPKRAFKTEGELETFRAIVHNNIGKEQNGI